MNRKIYLVAVLAVVMVVTAACSLSAPLAATPRVDVLQVPYINAGSVDPQDSVWQNTIPLNVPLTGIDIKGEWSLNLTPKVEVSALRDADHLYFKLSWMDDTGDGSWTDTDSFMDAVAVQLPVKSGSEPYICMGQKNELVNILYWRAGQEKGENMLAGGYGTLTSSEKSSLVVNSLYEKGRWTVVIVRPLAAQEKNVIGGQQMTSAFAVWNGANEQRGGRKSTSQWITLSFKQPEA